LYDIRPKRCIFRANSPNLFGLTISQGDLMNMFARTARAFEEKKG
jgi:hypothetical protein